MIRGLVVVGALLVALLGLNVFWQHVHCGTPVCRANPLQIIPCEPADKLEAEMAELTRRARENPAR